MFTRRLNNLPLFCLLLLGLLTSPVSTFGYVWCVGADGHAAMEPAVAGDCGLDHPNQITDGFAGFSETLTTDDCGPCLDVSPSYQMGSSRYRQDEIPANVAVEFTAPVVAAPLHSGRDLNIRRHINLPLRIAEPILHHRTIVLLI